MSYEVSEAAAWTVLSCVLALFTLLALGSTGRLPLPDAAQSLCLLRKKGENGDTQTADYFLAARNSAGYWAIAMRYVSLYRTLIFPPISDLFSLSSVSL